MQNLRIAALIPYILGHAYCGMVFPSKLKSFQSPENFKNWEMLTVLVCYVVEIINKAFTLFCWFLLAFAICKHQRKIKL